MRMNNISDSFRGLMPKTSTQALDFLKQYPEYDGRGVIIGIFDTGVDPGANGLQICPDGSPKILDLHDCTGSGDVDMRQKRKSELDLDTGKEYIIGLTGKKLLLNPEWNNPTKEYRVGIKAVYELFPEPLVSRMKAERRAIWEKEQNSAELAAARAINSSTADPKTKKELEERVTQLKAARDSYTDEGPVVDIVSFLDEVNLWRVLVDCDQTGELFKIENPLTIYRVERRYGTWDAKTQLNYGINIYENGDIVSIVMDSGSHGTHVAGIAAGYHGEDKQELNGVAPGAQIISFKIGDIRIGGMETGTGIIRALTAAAAAGIDVINMSFGEPSRSSGSGRVVELCRQLVLKHQIIFVASAGNSGPALSTVGAPGGSTPHLIGVGAYVEPEMMLAEYAMRPGETPASTHYTWSSRGPAFDGQLGVSISAPGGAVACVPTWTLSGKQLMNGTSMSSPNATGCIALLLSALKAQGIPRTPARIRRAIESTAAHIAGVDAFAQGHGLVQVAAAFECAKIGPDRLHLDLPFEVKISSRSAFTASGVAHGIYLREPSEANVGQEHAIEVSPLFATDVDDPDVGFNVAMRTTKTQQIGLEVRVMLEVTDGGSRFVRTPGVVLLTSKPCAFKIFVDPTILPKGSATFCEVVGYDADLGKAAGALFRVPVSVIRPEVVAGVQPNEALVARSLTSPPLLYNPVARFENLKMTPGELTKKFLQVPPGASWCDIRVVNERFNPEDRLFVLHCLQVRPQSRFRDDEMEAFVRLGGDVGASINRAVKVWGGGTLEVCIAPYWSALGDVQVTVEVQFGGVHVQPSMLALGAQNGFVAECTLRAELKDVRVEPSGELSKWLTTLAPNKTKTKLEARFPESRNAILGAFPPDSRPTWELRLWYDFVSSDKGKVLLKLPLRMNDFLYESGFDSQMMFVFDSKKRIVSVTDYGHTQKAFDAEKMTYNVIVIIRHEKKASLERLRESSLIAERNLSSNVALTCFSTPVGPSSGGFKFEPRILKRGFESVIYFSAPMPDELFKKVPAGCKQGDLLVGTFQVLKRNKDQTAFGSDDKPDGYPVCLVLPSRPGAAAAAAASEDKSASSGESKKPVFASQEEEQWTVPHLRAKLKLLENVQSKEIFDAQFSAAEAETIKLQTKFAKEEIQLQLALIRLRRAVKQFREDLKTFEGGERDNDEAVQSALAIVGICAEDVRSRVDVAALERRKAQGNVAVVDGELQEKEARGEAEAKVQTDALVEALLARIHCMLDVDAVFNATTPPSPDLSLLIEELGRWISDKALAVTQIKLRLSLRASRWAIALGILDKLLQEDESDLQKLTTPETKQSLMDRRIVALEELGWEHLVHGAKEQALVQFPAEFPLF